MPNEILNGVAAFTVLMLIASDDANKLTARLNLVGEKINNALGGLNKKLNERL